MRSSILKHLFHSIGDMWCAIEYSKSMYNRLNDEHMVNRLSKMQEELILLGREIVKELEELSE